MKGTQSTKRTSRLRTWSPQEIARVRVGIGIWLLLLAAILYTTEGGQWEWLLVGVAAIHLVLACRLFRAARHESAQTARRRAGARGAAS